MWWPSKYEVQVLKDIIAGQGKQLAELRDRVDKLERDAVSAIPDRLEAVIGSSRIPWRKQRSMLEMKLRPVPEVNTAQEALEATIADQKR